MIIIGAILAILGFVLGIGILLWLGVILLVVGAVLALTGGMGHAVGPRRHYW
jgi:membrane protein implicated in regulation of membrane protease activity